MNINTSELKRRADEKGWTMTRDKDGWSIFAHDATATCIPAKGACSPECVPTESYPRLYVTGHAPRVVELVRLIELCVVKDG